jgi:ATP-binding cassette subfamily B protein
MEKENVTHLVRRFVRYYGEHKVLVVLDLVSAVVRVLIMAIIPYVIVKLLDKQTLQTLQTREIITTLSIVSLLILIMGFAEFINVKWGHILGTRIEAAMRSDLFRHLQKLSFKYFDNTKTGHIMSRISNDLFMISELAHHGPEDFLISVALLMGSMVFMLLLSWQMTLVVMLPLPLILIWGNLFRMRLRNRFREVRKKVADINSNVENSIQGIREVQSYVNENYAIDRFEGANHEFTRAKSDMYGSMAGFHSGMLFLVEMYTPIIIGGGLLLVRAGMLDLVEMLGFIMYRRYIFQPIRRLVGFMEQFQRGVASFERFVEVMDEDPDIEDRPDAIAVDRFEGDIRFDNVRFKYYEEDESWILDDITLHIKPGQTVALVGESGAGKSTLASLIPRFYETNSGSIRIDGNDIMSLRKDDLRSLVGIVQQNVFLFDASIRENIMFGRPDATEAELIEASRRAQILNFVEFLDNGFDTQVGEHGIKLSGGQKQRVSIARLFLKDPAILIFDEATSSLDSESEMLIQEAMRDLCEGRTTVVIAHRLTTVKDADYTYVLRGGKIVEQGTHTELIEQGQYYCDLYTRNII